jgi:hypothetical protein
LVLYIAIVTVAMLVVWVYATNQTRIIGPLPAPTWAPSPT